MAVKKLAITLLLFHLLKITLWWEYSLLSCLAANQLWFTRKMVFTFLLVQVPIFGQISACCCSPNLEVMCKASHKNSVTGINWEALILHWHISIDQAWINWFFRFLCKNFITFDPFTIFGPNLVSTFFCTPSIYICLFYFLLDIWCYHAFIFLYWRCMLNYCTHLFLTACTVLTSLVFTVLITASLPADQQHTVAMPWAVA